MRKRPHAEQTDAVIAKCPAAAAAAEPILIQRYKMYAHIHHALHFSIFFRKPKFEHPESTLRLGRIQGLYATPFSSHLAGIRNKHFYSPLDGC